MPKQTIEVMIEGGKATAAPPLGPALVPLRVNTKAVVDEINEKTKDLKGMQVPVKVTVDTDKKTFEIEVGTPPVASLVKKELGIEKGSDESGTKRAGDMTEEQIKRIARTKFGSDAPEFVNQVKGTCRSMGVTIGQGAITEEELKKYEEMEKLKAEEEAAKATKGEAPAEAPAEEEKPEEKKEEKAEEKPKEKEKDT
jgi:large subunit ribosomal protein L11